MSECLNNALQLKDIVEYSSLGNDLTPEDGPDWFNPDFFLQKEINSAHNTNLNIKCEIVDNKVDKDSITINDIRELGYQYINLSNSSDFVYCENCGVIMKKKNRNDYSTKLCLSCLKELKNKNNLNWFHQLDKAYPFSD